MRNSECGMRNQEKKIQNPNFGIQNQFKIRTAKSQWKIGNLRIANLIWMRDRNPRRIRGRQFPPLPIPNSAFLLLRFLHFAFRTPHSAFFFDFFHSEFRIPHSAFSFDFFHSAFRTPHSAFSFDFFHSAFRTPHSPRFLPLRIPHSALRILLRFLPFRIPHSAFRIPHSSSPSISSIPNSALRIPHSSSPSISSIPHSEFRIPHSSCPVLEIDLQSPGVVRAAGRELNLPPLGWDLLAMLAETPGGS